MAKTSVKDVLTTDFKNLSGQAVGLKAKIKDAKTSLKKEYYSKKLHKLNKRVYALLLELAMLEARKKPKVEPTNSTEEVITNDEV